MVFTVQELPRRVLGGLVEESVIETEWRLKEYTVQKVTFPQDNQDLHPVSDSQKDYKSEFHLSSV